MNGIIPAAGKGVRFKELGKNYPKCILPVDGKPVIYWNIKDMLNAGCEEIFIVVSDVEQSNRIGTILNYFFPKVFEDGRIRFVLQRKKVGKGLSVAVYSAMDTGFYDLSKPTFIMLSDLRIENKNWAATNFRDDCSWISTQKVESFERWCMVEIDSERRLQTGIPKVVEFYDKPLVDPKTRHAVSGVYFFRDSGMLHKELKTQLEEDSGVINEEFQLSYAMREYNKKEPLRTLNYEVTDYGTLEEYLDNKDLKLGRSFNDIEIGSVVKKSSFQLEKIISEINWFRTMPEEIQISLPRIYSFDVGNKDSKAYYKMERLTGTSLRDIFLFLDSSVGTWKKILEEISNLTKKFRKHQTQTSVKTYNDFILSKTRIRMLDVQRFFTSDWAEWYVGWLGEVLRKRQDFEMTLIHGDLCFSNIFWNFQTEQVKLIDPRGDIFGNPLYDVAKLTHSILFNYDFIDEELYLVSDDAVVIMGNGKEEIKDLWIDYLFRTYGVANVKVILAITSSLFFSMIPLHSKEVNKWLFCQTGRRIFEFLENTLLTKESLKSEVHNEFTTFSPIPSSTTISEVDSN